jgi:S-formylglutathione hydrolase FrmB
MKNALRLVVALLLCLGSAYGQRGGFQNRDVIPDGSRVEYKTFHSALLNRDLRYGIYLPPSYAASPAKKYPVLYFLHGLDENEMRWSTRGQTDLMLDQLIASGKIGEFIVAVPFAAASFYTNARGGGEPWEDVIVNEFIPTMETTYRVDATRRMRGISGVSMGGYGALKIAFKHPELFGSVSAHSAVLVSNLNDATVPGWRLDQFVALFDHIFGIKQDMTYWDANNPLLLARDTARLQGMKIYVDCGAQDDYGFNVGLKAFDDMLTKSAYPHEAHVYPGRHGWDYAKQHTGESLAFHWDVFKSR